MRVGEVVAVLPEAESLLAEYGLHCSGCAMGGVETLEDGCQIHGFSQEDTEDLLSDLNALFLARQHLPQIITITEDAAHALGKILEENGKFGYCLRVGFDDGGKFFLEFLRKAPRGAKVFSHANVPSVRVVVAPLTFRRISGTTIDYRDGRFKLDLPTSSSG